MSVRVRRLLVLLLVRDWAVAWEVHVGRAEGSCWLLGRSSIGITHPSAGGSSYPPGHEHVWMPHHPKLRCEGDQAYATTASHSSPCPSPAEPLPLLRLSRDSVPEQRHSRRERPYRKTTRVSVSASERTFGFDAAVCDARMRGWRPYGRARPGVKSEDPADGFDLCSRRLARRLCEKARVRVGGRCYGVLFSGKLVRLSRLPVHQR